MASKRTLKKQINYSCDILFAECVATSLCNANAAQQDIDAILTEILITNSNYIRRISHPEPGLSEKAYFKDLIDSFNKDVQEIIDNISNLY